MKPKFFSRNWLGYCVLLLALACLFLNFVQPTFADETTEKFISNLQSAVDRGDKAALAKFWFDLNVNMESAKMNDHIMDHVLSMKNCRVLAGPPLPALDRVRLINGKKCGLNGNYQITLYFFSADEPYQGIFVPAGRIVYGGYYLLQPVELAYGVPVPGKSGFVVAPTNPGGIAADVRTNKRDEAVKDPYSGRFFLVP